jgi:DNA-binding MarR family transcriptional regulator
MRAAGHELNFSQYVTLKHLAEGTASVTDLATAAQVNPGAMTRLLDKLEQRGIIARVADPTDRRALRIHLTEAGLAIWQDINHCGQRVRERATRGMSDADRETLTRLLAQVRDNLSPSEG